MKIRIMLFLHQSDVSIDWRSCTITSRNCSSLVWLPVYTYAKITIFLCKRLQIIFLHEYDNYIIDNISLIYYTITFEINIYGMPESVDCDVTCSVISLHVQYTMSQTKYCGYEVMISCTENRWIYVAVLTTVILQWGTNSNIYCG